MYPQDARVMLYDVSVSGTSGNIATTTFAQTVLNLTVSCRANADFHLFFGNEQVLDTENVSFGSYVWHAYYPTSTVISYTKATNDHCSLSILSVPRNRASTTDTYPYDTIQNTLGMTPLTNYVVQVGALTSLWFVAFVCAYFLIKKFF